MATWKRVDSWGGGYVRQRVDETGRPYGQRVYVIEREVHGVRFNVSTRASTLAAAMRHLLRWERDPTAYTPAGETARVPAVRLTAALVADYHAHQLAKGQTREWADEVTRCLADWTEALGHLDLRRLSLHHDVKPALERWPRRKGGRIKALKGFMRWLRSERGLLTHSEDCTVDLRVPQAKPERFTRRKVVAPEDVAAVLRVLSQPYRDMLHLLTATAWHVSEVRRFVEAGELVRPASGAVLAVLLTRHKSGDVTRTPLAHQEHVDAAVRLKALKVFPKRMTLARKMREACDKAKVPRFGMGVMRHSVLTWAHERGANMSRLAEFAGHHNESTTRRFYVDAAVPTAGVPVLRLLP